MPKLQKNQPKRYDDEVCNFCHFNRLSLIGVKPTAATYARMHEATLGSDCICGPERSCRDEFCSFYKRRTSNKHPLKVHYVRPAGVLVSLCDKDGDIKHTSNTDEVTCGKCLSVLGYADRPVQIGRPPKKIHWPSDDAPHRPSCNRNGKVTENFMEVTCKVCRGMISDLVRWEESA